MEGGILCGLLEVDGCKATLDLTNEKRMGGTADHQRGGRKIGPSRFSTLGIWALSSARPMLGNLYQFTIVDIDFLYTHWLRHTREN